MNRAQRRATQRKRSAGAHAGHGPGEQCAMCADPDFDPLATAMTYIERTGWAVQGVIPGPGNVGFAYTVGLCLTGHPELLILGLGARQAQGVLNGFIEAIRAGQIPDAEPGQRRDDVYPEYPAWLLEVRDLDTGDYRPSLAVQYATLMERELKVLQIVWCDSSSRFPWDPDWTHAGQRPDPQPVLGTPPDLHRNEERS